MLGLKMIWSFIDRILCSNNVVTLLLVFVLLYRKNITHALKYTLIIPLIYPFISNYLNPISLYFLLISTRIHLHFNFNLQIMIKNIGKNYP